jgi:hypothetical protein
VSDCRKTALSAHHASYNVRESASMQAMQNQHTLSLIFTIAVVISIVVQAVVAIVFSMIIAKTAKKLGNLAIR